MKRYLKIWWIFTKGTTQIALTSRFGAVLFIFGKALRFVMFLFLLSAIFSKVPSIQGYTFWEIVFFFATFNVVDVSTQLLLREVYRFRNQVITGYLDFVLLWPISPLLKELFGGTDALDIPMFILAIAFLVIASFHMEGISVFSFLIYVSLLVNSFLIALAFHIVVLALGILTTEVDNAIMLYRDMTQMGRFPIDIYREPLRGFITFVIPVGIMITFPAKALMGLLSLQNMLIAFSIGIISFYISLHIWRFALKRYSSASS